MEPITVVFPLALFVLYILVGVILCAAIDHEDRWLNWLNKCPSQVLQFVILVLWPALFLTMLATWRKWRKPRGQ